MRHNVSCRQHETVVLGSKSLSPARRSQTLLLLPLPLRHHRRRLKKSQAHLFSS